MSMLKWHRSAALALTGALLAAPASFAQACPQADGHPNATLASLIANPVTYHGKAVSVVAYVTIEFENMTACPSKDDTEFSHSIKHCLWLTIDDGPFKTDADYERYQTKLQAWQRFNRQRVVLRANFDKTEKGHFSMWPGGLGKVCDVSLP